MTLENHPKVSYEVSSSGHRQRLRERFQKSTTEGFHDYEVLELLLTYAIPRRDVKPLAKALIHHFHNLNGVMDAPLPELLGISDMGTNSALLIKLVKEMGTLYMANRLEKKDALISPHAVVGFAKMKLSGLPHEAFMVIFLNVQNEVMNHEIMNEGTIDQVAVYPRRIIEKALSYHAAGLIIVHNHPSGHILPSDDDKKLTRSIKEAAHLFQIRILDHIIVSQNNYFSFIQEGLL